MSRKKVSTTIYITPEQAERLKMLHERSKVPIAVYIREGIDMVLNHYEHMLPGQMTFEAAVPPASSPSAGLAAPAPAPPNPAPVPAGPVAAAGRSKPPAPASGGSTPTPAA